MTEPSPYQFGDPGSPGHFRWEQTESARVLHVLGEVDLSNASQVMRALEDLGDRSLVVDLTEVDFIDSTGLGYLVELQSNSEREVGLKVVAGSQVDRLLELTGLKSAFTVDLVAGG
jgi:anti-sigma B factor antagonist